MVIKYRANDMNFSSKMKQRIQQTQSVQGIEKTKDVPLRRKLFVDPNIPLYVPTYQNLATQVALEVARQYSMQMNKNAMQSEKLSGE